MEWGPARSRGTEGVLRPIRLSPPLPARAGARTTGELTAPTASGTPRSDRTSQRKRTACTTSTPATAAVGSSPGGRDRTTRRRSAPSRRLEPLQAHEVVPLHLLEPLPDERLGRLELRDHAVLEGVHAPLHLLDLLD